MRNSQLPPQVDELGRQYFQYVEDFSEINNGKLAIWYYKKAFGRETVGNVVKEIMKKAGFERHYTNRSLRRSSASRLYDDAGMPEQVIPGGDWSSIFRWS